MEKQDYIDLVIQSGKKALSNGHTNSVIYNFVVQYQNSDSLTFESEIHKAIIGNDYKTWYVNIAGNDYKIGEFPDFWKPVL